MASVVAWLTASKWRAYAALVLLSVVPLALFLYAADRLLRRYTTEALTRQSFAATDLTARILEERIAPGEAFLTTLADEPGLVEALTRSDQLAMERLLAQACPLHNDFRYCSVRDANGVLRASYPPVPLPTGAAPPDWAAHLRERPRVQISGVYQPSFDPTHSYIALTARLRDRDGRSPGMVVGLYPMEIITRWLRQSVPSGVKWISVIDQNGRVIAEPDASGYHAPVDLRTYAPVQDMLAGHAGTGYFTYAHRRVLVTHYPIPSLHWGVLVQLPLSELDNNIWTFEKPLAWAALVFLLVALAFGNVGAWLYRRLGESERRLRDKLLVESAQRYQRLFDASPQPMWVFDPETLRFLDVNRAAVESYGYSRAEFLGMTIKDIRPPEDVPALLDNIRETADKDDTGIWRHRTRDGRLLTVEISQSTLQLDGKQAALIVANNITERVEAEQNRELLASIVQSSDDAIVSKTLDGVITAWNRGAEALFGYSAEEAIGKPMSIVIPADRANEEDEILARMSRGEHLQHFETERVTKDGIRVEISTSISPLRRRDGKIVGASVITRNITDRKNAERKLAGQMERLHLLEHVTRAIAERQDLRSIFQVVIRTLEENLPVDFCCICLYDQDTKELTVTSVGAHSEALARELTLAENVRIPIDQNGLSRCVRGEVVYEPDVSVVAMPFPQRLATQQLRSLVVAPLLAESLVFGILVAARHRPASFSSGECEFLRQVSEHVALAAHQARLNDALQRAYDDLRQTQAAVMQHERLRALGQMASGIAHDINNAISPAMVYADMLLEQESQISAAGRTRLVTIQRAMSDVAHTVSRMSEFYRRREPQLALKPVSLNQIAQQVLDLTRARWSDMPQQQGIAIEMRTELRPDLPATAGVDSEIREALINLVFNAVDALVSGGIITLRTGITEGPQPQSIEGSAPRFAFVEVEDNGVGMSEETQRHCMEPFYTTKGSRGSGLGLAMVYGIAQRHGAEVEMESQVGRGTRVRLIFPLQVPASAQAPQSGVTTMPTRQRVLIIDDDPLLLRSLQEMLEGDGHFVVVASGGQAGIDAFHVHLGKDPFSVVITDLGMPRVDGRQVAGAIKAAAPKIPVILLTGWGQRLEAEGDVPRHVDLVLSKPPRLADLRAALTRVTARPQDNEKAV